MDVMQGQGFLLTDWYQIRLNTVEAVKHYEALSFDCKAALQLLWAKEILGAGRVVIADRLHAHILCMLMRVPHILLENSIGKLGAFAKSWTADSELVRWAQTPQQALAIAQEWAVTLHQETIGSMIPVIQEVIQKRLTYLSADRLQTLVEA
ncbi:MAG: hypothetical protein EBY11_15060, partial [Proteobacteria bacterium]|nr:hypothetical protein [Pseudomonadota bacterium]